MPAFIAGTVFNDIDRNATFSAGVPGISGVFVSLEAPGVTCRQLQSDINGNYSFNNVSIPGTYRIYETVTTPNACPPTLFTQPSGYNISTTARVVSIDVTQTQIDTNTTLGSNDFGHQNIPSAGCPTEGLLFSGNPTRIGALNIVKGTNANLGTLSPGALRNAFGYSGLNNIIYGVNASNSRIIALTFPTTTNTLGVVAGLSTQTYTVGDVDLNAHYYIYATNSTIYRVIDINPNSATYLKNVDPSNSFQEQVSAAGFPITALNISDWAFNPIDGNLYAIVNNTGDVVRINPLTAAQTVLVTSGSSTGTFGACYFDTAGNFYTLKESNGQITRFVLSATTADGVLFSTVGFVSNTDGARCPYAPLNLLSISLATDHNVASAGTIITYTVTVKNISNIPLGSIVVTGSVPNGTSFINGSVKINGTPDGSNPTTGILSPPLVPGSGNTNIITYQVLVLSGTPTPNPMPNTASVSYASGTTISSLSVDTTVLDGYRGLPFID